MKKQLFLALILCGAALMPVFGQEKYTLHYSGDVEGTVTIERGKGGKITITCKLPKTPLFWEEPIDHGLCPLIPEKVSLRGSINTMILDGNTTAWTYTYGGWGKTVVDGNTTTETDSTGYWKKTVVDGNTTTSTRSNGHWELWGKTVVDGSTTTVTDATGYWGKTVVDGNTTTTTYLDGHWKKTVVGGNTTTVTRSSGGWEKRVVDKQGYDIFITITRGR